jgi:hypothetical protein
MAAGFAAHWLLKELTHQLPRRLQGREKVERKIIRSRQSLIEWVGTVTHPFDANSGRWQQSAETAASSH